MPCFILPRCHVFVHVTFWRVRVLAHAGSVQVMKILEESRHAAMSQRRWGSHPWPPDIDLFASEEAHQCPMYFAEMWDRSCIGMDAYLQDWGAWPKALQHARPDGGAGNSAGQSRAGASGRGSGGGRGSSGSAAPGGRGVLDGESALRKNGEGAEPGGSRARRSGVVMHAIASASERSRLAKRRALLPSRRQPVCFAFPPRGHLRRVLRKAVRDRATLWLVHPTELAVTDEMLLDSLPVLFSRSFDGAVSEWVKPTERNTAASGKQWSQDLEICLISWE